MKRIFLDYASSYANPNAIHREGVLARKKIEKARETVARILGAQPDEIIFTGSGTESNNLAILGLVKNFPKAHIVTTNIEHPSVLETAKRLNTTFVPVESNGIVDPKKIKKALKPNTILVSVMYANNEIGTIQPVQEIAKVIRQHRKAHFTREAIFPLEGKREHSKMASRAPFFHIDACQAMNYLPINVQKLGVDLMTFNGSKIYGPTGIGVLYRRRGVPLVPIMYGGNQEFGLRPGTENVPAIVGLARSLEITEKKKEKESARLTKLRDYFIKKLKNFKNIVINGDLINRLPNNVNISVQGVESELLVLELDARGIAVSSKSACKSNEVGGFSIRFSLGRDTKKEYIDYVLKSLKGILEKLKKWYN